MIPQKIIMLQRIQTVYIILSALCSGVLSFLLPLWKNANESYYAIDSIEYFSLFMASTVLAVVAVFQFKSRQTQFVVCRLSLIHI